MKLLNYKARCFQAPDGRFLSMDESKNSLIKFKAKNQKEAEQVVVGLNHDGSALSKWSVWEVKEYEEPWTAEDLIELEEQRQQGLSRMRALTYYPYQQVTVYIGKMHNTGRADEMVTWLSGQVEVDGVVKVYPYYD